MSAEEQEAPSAENMPKTDYENDRIKSLMDRKIPRFISERTEGHGPNLANCFSSQTQQRIFYSAEVQHSEPAETHYFWGLGDPSSYGTAGSYPKL